MTDLKNVYGRSNIYAAPHESGKINNHRTFASDSSGLSVASFPIFECSMRQVLRAGEALKGEILWTKEAEPEIIEIFRIANNWRESHAYPMRSLRHEMIAKMRGLEMEGITAARLKRMRSIRKKLRAISAKLNQIQDLGGCRAILPSIGEARRLIDEIKNNSHHTLHNESDYINSPKIGGYRSHHLIFKFRGVSREEIYSGRRIEIQIRTRLQHSWATAVEAVGLFRREDMKAGQGNADWLRLFDLMSAELALAENCPESESASPRSERVREIRELDRSLHAVKTLRKLRDAVRYTEKPRFSRDRPEYYRIEYNNTTDIVEVTEHFLPIPALSELNKAEEYDNIHDDNRINTVFVEADKIEDLKEAYPNYFGDVELFNVNLQNITEGMAAREYTMAPLKSPPPPQKARGDLAWLRPGLRRRWE